MMEVDLRKSIALSDAPKSPLAVDIVTYASEPLIRRCLSTLLACARPPHKDESLINRTLATDATVVAVIVTYSNRWPSFGRETLARVVAAGPDQVIVVDNGSDCSTEIASDCSYLNNVTYLPTGSNLGSAGGFGAGVRKAIELGCDLVWLIDDDMWPLKEALDSQLTHYSSGSRMVVTGRRDSHSRERFERSLRFDAGAYLGKDLLRLHHTRRQSDEPLDFFPYGGSLVPREAIVEAGFPNGSYFAYWDDFDWADRIKRCGYQIKVTDACLYLMQDVTNPGIGIAQALRFLRTERPELLYYRVRNEISFRSRVRRDPVQAMHFRINRLSWLAAIRVVLAGRRWAPNKRAILAGIRDASGFDQCGSAPRGS